MTGDPKGGDSSYVNHHKKEPTEIISGGKSFRAHTVTMEIVELMNDNYSYC